MQPAPDPRYDPFIRSDQYGHLGHRPQSFWEYARLGLCSITVVPLKTLGSLVCLTTFFVICRLSAALPRHQQAALVPFCGKLACRACLFCLGFFHIRWVRADEHNRTGTQSFTAAQRVSPDVPAMAIVSNHCGWPDILVHMSRSFPSFVARAATQDLFMIGLISQLMGCVYVDRATAQSKHKGMAAIVKDRISKAAVGQSQGQRPMLLFPESTTTNGEYMLDFKTGAFLAGVPVQPVILKYGKGRVSPSWDTISAARHIFLMLANPVHSLTVTEYPIYHPSREEQQDPALYASNVRKYMLKMSGLKASTATLNDKWVLHNRIREEQAALKQQRPQRPKAA